MDGNLSIKKPPTFVGGFLLFVFRQLDALHVGGARALVGLLRFKGHCITDLEFVEKYADERGLMKKQIFVLTFLGDETKTLVGQAFNRSLHRMYTIMNEFTANNGYLRKID